MIPLILHQIWYQGIDNIRQPYKDCFINTIKYLKNTKWDHQFWYKERIEDFIQNNYSNYWDLYNNCNVFIQKLDIARYLILYHYGGCYMDMDMEMIKDFSILIEPTDSLIVSNRSINIINNGILFSSPKNIFWIYFLEDIRKKINKFKFYKYLNVTLSTGPINFNNFINKNKHIYKIKILEYKYLEPCESKYNQNITKEAFVINNFANSWMSPFEKIIIFLYTKRKFILILLFISIICMLISFCNRNK